MIKWAAHDVCVSAFLHFSFKFLISHFSFLISHLNNWFYLALKDASFHNPVVWPIGFTVVRRMADGIFPCFEELEDELLVFLIMGKAELHLVNRSDDLMPSGLP